ncbi:MAG TPA: ABC transporter ATP-binding protein [Phycisphaeraceae bacterium]
MAQPAIQVENLSKQYRLGQAGSLDRTLRDALAAGLTRWRGQAAPRAPRVPQAQAFWALRDVSFDVEPGEAVGIIGPNGAGKSTLLKILAQITPPTAGRVVLRGPVASLLEVGTGFHPELTGRENIYLNGAILGMSRREVRARFDQIVAFSGVEKFLDTPVKRYSSGMRVRLAFAVASHLDPQVLIIDEVLAVGDAAFQERCLGRMRQMASEGGRTVLFVSHNMSVVRSLCQRAILLEAGRVVEIGDSADVVARYFQRQNQNVQEAAQVRWSQDAAGDSPLRLLALELADGDGQPRAAFTPQEPVAVAITYELTHPVPDLRWVVQVRTAAGETAFTTTDHAQRDASHRQPGRYTSRCVIPGGLLNNGGYLIRAWAGIPNQRCLIETGDVLKLRVDGVGNHGSKLGEARWPGVVCPRLEWSIQRCAARSAA